TQKELSVFLEKEQAQARMIANTQNITATCWDKCITGTPSTKFSRSEENCLTYCAERFLDTSIFLVNKVQGSRVEETVFSS
ncbi:Tim10/DDP family zinc finger-domain-containing protein, partial [Amanita rubescens]